MKKGKFEIMRDQRESAVSSIMYLLRELRSELQDRQMEEAEYTMQRIESEIATYRKSTPEWMEPDPAFEALVEDYQGLVAPVKAVQRDAAIAREAARIKGENAATDNQIAYLVSLGYSYDGSYLSKAEASAKIEACKANRQRDYLASEMIKVGRQEKTFIPFYTADCPALQEDKLVLLSAVEYLLSAGYIVMVTSSNISPIYDTYILTRGKP